ncbi:zinc finger C2HC domain-containing protein 1A isoform X1 [Entelurus aequoreus]|uniref:zinc finger C2HC domain-containing protein 1A isoform X1 n=1 Tax=Entelurus aequoreus TaxID=161455 RepID=UPI002B1D2E76|nr:zinc finger C2HC domain-containing protein 1A isoform X1 [Entelurus aequoreus]
MMDEFEDGDAPPAGDLAQCNTCKRMFFPKVLDKHSKICQKSAAKKRKTFDSSRQRAQGTDIPTLKPLKPKAEPPKKPSNWRKKHEDFIATIRKSRGKKDANADETTSFKDAPSLHNEDLEQCPHCQRTFIKSSAERHIAFCKEQAARLAIKKPPTRTQYKSPVVKKANSTASAIPMASTRPPPQRSGLGQTTGVSLSQTLSAASKRTNTTGLTSPGSGLGMKNRAVGSGYGSLRNPAAVRGPLNKNKQENSCITRDGVDGGDNVGNGKLESKFCHSCGTRYPIESAKFCCECGIRRMCI